MKYFHFFFCFLLSAQIMANTITLSWTFQPDKSTDFTVGEREGVVTLENQQGINFQKAVVDSQNVDFFVQFVQNENRKRFVLNSSETSEAEFIEIGETEAHTVPLAPESGYNPRPLLLKTGYTYCMITADGFHYARLYVISQMLEDPVSGDIETSDVWVPAEVTYYLPVETEKMERFELPYLDREITVQGEINLKSLDLVEQLTDERKRIEIGSIQSIKNYPQIVRDSFTWWNLGKVLKYYKMKRRFTSVSIEDGFMDINHNTEGLVTTFPPDTAFFLLRQNQTEDTLYFTSFFWMEELGKSKYSYVWDRTYNERHEKKFVKEIKILSTPN